MGEGRRGGARGHVRRSQVMTYLRAHRRARVGRSEGVRRVRRVCGEEGREGACAPSASARTRRACAARERNW
eukprot:349781-Chlamydomonas_euryale.AAC.2